MLTACSLLFCDATVWSATEAMHSSNQSNWLKLGVTTEKRIVCQTVTKASRILAEKDEDR